MEIILTDISKRFRYEWIFRDINYHFEDNKAYAVLGPNGSGKSTFMKILCGHLTPSKGKIEFLDSQKAIDPDQVYKQLSYCAPYIELIEEFNLQEAIEFQSKFKPWLAGLDNKAVLEISQLSKSKDKPIKYFSSGMKQRLKLCLSICANSQLLLLDEPTTNLDEEGANWYHDLIHRFRKDRTVIVASNVPEDYDFCDAKIRILDYKKGK